MASCSWFAVLNSKLIEYGLPNIKDLLDSPISKAQWKSMCQLAVSRFHLQVIHERVKQYSSLKRLFVCHSEFLAIVRQADKDSDRLYAILAETYNGFSGTVVWFLITVY